MKKKIPVFKSDKEAEDFVDKVDLTEFDLSVFHPVQFIFNEKLARKTKKNQGRPGKDNCSSLSLKTIDRYFSEGEVR